MAKSVEFWTLLRQAQEYISQRYAAALIDPKKTGQLRAYIDQFLREQNCSVEWV